MSNRTDISGESRGGEAAAQGGSNLAGTYVLLLALVVVWGANWPIVKLGLRDIPPFWLGSLRLALGAIALFVIVGLRGQLHLPRRGDWLMVVDVGLGQMCAFMVLLNVALQYVDANRAVIIAYTTPIWVAPAAVLLLGERLTPRMIAGFLLGLVGMLLLFNPASFDWHDRLTVLGNGLLILAALIWTALILHVRVHKWVSGPFELAPWQALVAVVPATVIALLFEDFGQIAWTDRAYGVIAYNGVLATAFGVWAMVTVSRVLPAISSSLGFLGAPVVGYLSASWILGEPMTTTLSIGLALIVGGVFLVLSAGTAPQGRAG